MVERNWDYMAHGFYNTRPITNYTIEQPNPLFFVSVVGLLSH